VHRAIVRGLEKNTTETSNARHVLLNRRAHAALLRQRASTQLAGDFVFLDARYGKPWTEERTFRSGDWAPTLKALGLRFLLWCDPVVISMARHAALKPVIGEIQAQSHVPKPPRTRSANRTAMLRAGSNGSSPW
jgi:hypothetical protein